MAKEFNLEIVTPNGTVFDDTVFDVCLPGSEGVFTVMSDHSSIFSELIAGTITIHNKSNIKDIMVIDGGYTLVKDNSVKVIVRDLVVIKEGKSISDAINNIKDMLKGVSNADNIIASLYKMEHTN